MPLASFDTTASALSMSWAIAASAEQVWRCLTEPADLALWLGELVTGSISSKQSFVIDHGEGYCCTSTVARFEPDRCLAYSWKFADEERTEVSWTLSPSDESTTLVLAHTGLDDLVASYLAGWVTHLTFLEGVALGSPLPASMFWPIHGTIARLNALG